METTNLVMPQDLNPGGTLFGGKIMAEMDKFAAIYATDLVFSYFNKYSEIIPSDVSLVTVHVSELTFKVPIKLHDVYKLNAGFIKFGNSSVTIKVYVTKKHMNSAQENFEIATEGIFTFVAVKDGKRYIFNDSK